MLRDMGRSILCRESLARTQGSGSPGITGTVDDGQVGTETGGAARGKVADLSQASSQTKPSATSSYDQGHGARQQRTVARFEFTGRKPLALQGLNRCFTKGGRKTACEPQQGAQLPAVQTKATVRGDGRMRLGGTTS